MGQVVVGRHHHRIITQLHDIHLPITDEDKMPSAFLFYFLACREFCMCTIGLTSSDGACLQLSYVVQLSELSLINLHITGIEIWTMVGLNAAAVV